MIDIDALTDEEAIATALLFGADFWLGPLSKDWFIEPDIEGFEQSNWGWETKGDCARAFCRWKLGELT